MIDKKPLGLVSAITLGAHVVALLGVLSAIAYSGAEFLVLALVFFCFLMLLAAARALDLIHSIWRETAALKSQISEMTSVIKEAENRKNDAD